MAILLLPVLAHAQYYYGSVLSPDDQARLDALRRSQSEADAKHRAEMKAFREKLLRSAPLPGERNVLLGRWRVDGGGKPRGKDDVSQLMGMITNPTGAMCEVIFGGGMTEFLPKSWASIDSYGNDSLGSIQYRAAGKDVIVAIPAKGVEQLVFQVASPNRVELFEGCALVRVGAASGASTDTAGTAANARAAASARPSPAAGGAPQVATAAPTPAPSSPGRPSAEVCRQTLLDKLGTVGVNQVRQMTDLRFKETLEGKVPNTGNLRLDARGSGCDDPRINAVLYDFDANGLLQSITYVWARPAGPAPAPIFQERVATLSRFHSLPPPQSAGRLQADTTLGRLVLQDVPERNLLLEAYAARR